MKLITILKEIDKRIGRLEELKDGLDLKQMDRNDREKKREEYNKELYILCDMEEMAKKGRGM
jgi:hypothetical protein